MILIIGLGNPGEKYKNTRHNIGFKMVEELREIGNFSAFKFQKESKALVCEGSLNDKEVALARPMGFMNNSGISVRVLRDYYKIKHSSEEKNIMVIHDDIDLPLGKIRLHKDKSSAGHKGVESIIKELKTKNFIRIRMGILPNTGKPKKSETFVIQKFNKNEEQIIKEVTVKTVEAIGFILKDGLEKAMNKYNC